MEFVPRRDLRNIIDQCEVPELGSGVRYFLAMFGVQTLPAGSATGWVFKPPPDTMIESIELYRVATSYSSNGSGGVYRLNADAPQGAGARTLERCGVGEYPTCAQLGQTQAPYAASNRFTASHIGARSVYAVIECYPPGFYCDPPYSLSHTASIVIYTARVGLDDAYLPEIMAEPSGSLVAPRVEGERSLSFSARDRGGGLARTALVVDGVQMAPKALFSAEGFCQEPYSRIVPCPLAATPTVTFDTTQIPNGTHQLQLAVIDAGGNQTVSRRWTTEIRNGSRPNGVGATTQAKLTVWVRAKRSERRSRATVSFGRASVIEGRLITPDGTPIGDAAVEVSSRLQRQVGESRRRGSVVTDAKGRFIFNAGRGASRVYHFGYRALTLDEVEATSAEARIDVRARVALSVSPNRARNGTRIRFSGRLLGGPGQKGTLVTIYAVQSSGRRRIPVDTVAADAAGRFGLGYRFRNIGGRFTFRFQARVVRQPTYPYAAGGSRIVRVRARP
jgi:hypothetical protein